MGLTRRGLISGLVSFLAAPAIVRVGSLDLVRGVPLVTDLTEASLTQALIEMRELGLGYTITRMAVEDNLYNKYHALTGEPPYPWFDNLYDAS